MKKALTVTLVFCVFAFTSFQNTDKSSLGKISDIQNEPIVVDNNISIVITAKLKSVFGT